MAQPVLDIWCLPRYTDVVKIPPPPLSVVNISKPKHGIDGRSHFQEQLFRLWLRIRRNWQLYVLLILPLAWLIVFRYAPMYGA